MKKFLLITLLTMQIQLVGTVFSMNHPGKETEKSGLIPLNYQCNNSEYFKVEKYMYFQCKKCPICLATFNLGIHYPMVFPCRFHCCLQCIKADPKVRCLTCGMICDQELLKKRIQALEGN